MGANAEAFLLFDASESSDKLKAVQIHTDSTAQDASGNTPGYNYSIIARHLDFTV